jgi:hypothetical protein
MCVWWWIAVAWCMLGIRTTEAMFTVDQLIMKVMVQGCTDLGLDACFCSPVLSCVACEVYGRIECIDQN